MQYLKPDQQDRASILLLKLEKFGPVSVVYREYDWSINSSWPVSLLYVLATACVSYA